MCLLALFSLLYQGFCLYLPVMEDTSVPPLRYLLILSAPVAALGKTDLGLHTSML